MINNLIWISKPISASKAYIFISNIIICKTKLLAFSKHLSIHTKTLFYPFIVHSITAVIILRRIYIQKKTTQKNTLKTIVIIIKKRQCDKWNEKKNKKMPFNFMIHQQKCVIRLLRIWTCFEFPERCQSNYSQQQRKHIGHSLGVRYNV